MYSSVFSRLIERITDNYNKEPSSNISKMMDLTAHHVQENENLLMQIGEWRDVDQAEGVTLDYIGRNVGQDREGFDDKSFRVLIKARIIRNNSDGSIPTIIRFLAFILGVAKNQILVKERWLDGEPVGLYIEVDLEFVYALGLPLEDFAYIVNELLSSGVNAEIWFRGSFTFSTTDAVEEDADKGFGDVVGKDYSTGNFIMSDAGGEYIKNANIQSDDISYYRGDYAFDGSDDVAEGLAQLNILVVAHGFADAEPETVIGGRFGAYFKKHKFPDGDIIKPW